MAPYAAAAGGERDRPLKLPPEPKLGPGSSPGRRLGDMQRQANSRRCVHAVGLAGATKEASGHDGGGDGAAERKALRRVPMTFHDIP